MAREEEVVIPTSSFSEYVFQYDCNNYYYNNSNNKNNNKTDIYIPPLTGKPEQQRFTN